jgi:hypothetical protein
METSTRMTPKNNRNTEKFYWDWKYQPDEEKPEKITGDFGSFRCIPCTDREHPGSLFKEEIRNL